MSDDDAVDAINKALENQLDGIDCEGIANYKLRNLDKDYANTIAANIKTSNVVEFIPVWEADFSDQCYEQCPSDDEEPTEEIPKMYTRDLYLPPENIEKIKKIMAKIHLKPPLWAKNLPENLVAQHFNSKILK
jgi:hypothetical protein